MPIPGIESATSALSFASTLAEIAHENRGDRRHLRPIVQALRGIYFTPRGTLKILAVLAEGNEPDPNDVRDVLLDFNDAEWEVGRLIERLDFDYLDRFADLSLRQRRVLSEIAYGKRNLRRDLQESLNIALTRGEKIDPDDVRILLRRVESLNKLIESLEEEIL